MFDRLPIKVNPYRLAEQKRCLDGSSSLKSMSRLNGMCVQNDEFLSVQLEFQTIGRGYPRAVGSIKGQVLLICERCLEPFASKVSISVDAVFARSAFDLDEELNGLDLCVLNDGDELFVSDFIEDELLLALPVYNRHGDQEACRQDLIHYSDAAIETTWSDPSGDVLDSTKNPFEALRHWKKTE